MQYRRPVGGGPSSNTWPRCPPHRLQCTSVRVMPKLRSVVLPMAPSMGAKKLGHPVRLSNLRSAVKRGWPHPAHRNVPSRCSVRSAHEPGRSVEWRRSTAYCSGVSNRRHSSSDFSTGNRRDSIDLYLASGLGLTCHFTTLLVVPFPVSVWNGARVAKVE